MFWQLNVIGVLSGWVVQIFHMFCEMKSDNVSIFFLEVCTACASPPSPPGRYPDLRRYRGLYVDCWARTPNKVWGLCVKDAAGYQAQMYFQVDFQAPEGTFGRAQSPAMVIPKRSLAVVTVATPLLPFNLSQHSCKLCGTILPLNPAKLI